MLDRNKLVSLPIDVWRLILNELGVNNLWSLVLTAKFFDNLIEEFHEKKLIKLFKDEPLILAALRDKKFKRLRHLYVTLMHLISDTAVPPSLIRFVEFINSSEARLAALYCIDDNLKEFQKSINSLAQPTPYLLLAVACRSYKIANHYLSLYKTDIRKLEWSKKFLDMAYFSGDIRLVNLVYDVLGDQLRQTINFHTLKFAVFSGNTKLAQEVKTYLNRPRGLILGISVAKLNDMQKDIVLDSLLNVFAIRSKNPLMIDLVLTWIEEYKVEHPDIHLQLNTEALTLALNIGKPDMIAKVTNLLSDTSYHPLAIWRNHLMRLEEVADPFKSTYKVFIRLLRYILEDTAIKNSEHKNALLLSVLFLGEDTIVHEGKQSAVLFDRYAPIKQVIENILLASNAGKKFDSAEIAFSLRQLLFYIDNTNEFVWQERIGANKTTLLMRLRNMIAGLKPRVCESTLLRKSN